MAESNVEQEQQPNSTSEDVQGKEKLKYLGFVQVTAIQMLIYFSKLYDVAKNNSGPLKPGVQSVEGAVKTVGAPLYEKIHGFPYGLLQFVDRKVDHFVSKLEHHTPTLLHQACAVSQEALAVTKSIVVDVHQNGVVGTATGLAKATAAKFEPTAKKLYLKYEPVAEQYAVSTWQSLNKLPLFPQVAHIVVPTAAYWSEKYNGVVIYGRDSGYAVAAYLPSIPLKRIAKVFGPSETNNGAITEGEGAVVATAE